jgi:hypothetical protein
MEWSNMSTSNSGRSATVTVQANVRLPAANARVIELNAFTLDETDTQEGPVWIHRVADALPEVPVVQGNSLTIISAIEQILANIMKAQDVTSIKLNNVQTAILPGTNIVRYRGKGGETLNINTNSTNVY